MFVFLNVPLPRLCTLFPTCIVSNSNGCVHVVVVATQGALPAIAPEPSPEELRDYLASADGAIADIAEDGASSVEGAAAAVTSPISGESTESVEGAVSRNSNSSGGEQKEEATALEETKETKDADDNAEEPPSTFGFDFVIDQPSVFDFNSNFFEVCFLLHFLWFALYISVVSRKKNVRYTSQYLTQSCCPYAYTYDTPRCWCDRACLSLNFGAPFGLNS